MSLAAAGEVRLYGSAARGWRAEGRSAGRTGGRCRTELQFGGLRLERLSGAGSAGRCSAGCSLDGLRLGRL
ncbi:hypothetical protein ACFPN7_22145 [Amycolatopsis halotolerans]|uniref:hypothetical protein n=1 Tax=Amycolatopsis halotolerans TaxID=330083 RepID=UPI00361BBC7E